MAIDNSLIELYFKGGYKRGAVLRFEMKCDDPNRERRFKFGVVLNKDLGDSEALLLLTTSKTQKFDHFFDDDVVRIPAGQYEFFSLDTVISLREVRGEKLDFLKTLAAQKLLTFEGNLSDADMTDIDQKISASKLIEGQIKKRIL